MVRIYPQEERAYKHIEAASGAIEVEEEYGKIEGEIEDVGLDVVTTAMMLMRLMMIWSCS